MARDFMLDADKRTHFVYRIFDEFEQLLYVGCTGDLTKRLRQHRAEARNKPWVEYAVKVTARGPFRKRDAFDLEKLTIDSETPFFNVPSGDRSASVRAANEIRRAARELLEVRPELRHPDMDDEFTVEYERIQSAVRRRYPLAGAEARHSTYLKSRRLRLISGVAS